MKRILSGQPIPAGCLGAFRWVGTAGCGDSPRQIEPFAGVAGNCTRGAHRGASNSHRRI